MAEWVDKAINAKMGATLTDISSNLLLANPVMSNSDTMGAIGAALGFLALQKCPWRLEHLPMTIHATEIIFQIRYTYYI